jgi:hypothetical protein
MRQTILEKEQEVSVQVAADGAWMALNLPFGVHFRGAQ